MCLPLSLVGPRQEPLLCECTRSSMHSTHPLVAAAILPHGDFVYDPSLLKSDDEARREAQKLQTAAEDVASGLCSLDLDTLIIITPHGLSAEEDMVVYLGDCGSGYAEIGRDVTDGTAEPYIVPCKDVRLDDELSKALWRDLRNQGCAITGLTSFGGYEDVPLRYGEIIPLSFVRQSLRKEGKGRDCSKKKDPSCVIISLPNRRYQHGSEMVEEMVEFGSKLYGSLGRIFAKERVAILVSADLAHTHAEDGPYGFSPAADPFDNACCKWAATLDEKPLLHDARQLLDDAKSCGYLGLVVLHGVLNQGRDWDCQLGYYGMMVSLVLSADRKKGHL